MILKRIKTIWRLSKLKEVQEADTIYAEKGKDIHTFVTPAEPIGKGDAVYFSEGTEEEFIEEERKNSGMSGWYRRIRNL
jgi:hypothetical protein